MILWSEKYNITSKIQSLIPENVDKDRRISNRDFLWKASQPMTGDFTKADVLVC